MLSLGKFSIILLFLSILLECAEVIASNCPEEQYLVRAHKRSGYYRTDGIYVSPATVSAYCKSYRNFKSAKLHFSNKKATQKRSKSFSEDEKRKISKAFERLPGVLTKFGKITFERKSFGRFPKNPATADPDKKIITVYDSISRYNMERVVGHELAHFLYDSLSDAKKRSYRTVAEWEYRKHKGKELNVLMRKSFVAMDSMMSPAEDFANNIEYYLFEEKTLEKKNPKIYGWIKRFMEGSKK